MRHKYLRQLALLQELEQPRQPRLVEFFKNIVQQQEGAFAEFLQPFDMSQLEADQERFFLSLRSLGLHRLAVERKEPVFHMRPVLGAAIVEIAAACLLEYEQQVFGAGRSFILHTHLFGPPA